MTAGAKRRPCVCVCVLEVELGIEAPSGIQ